MSYLNKRAAPSGPDGGQGEAGVGVWGSEFPALAEFLAACRWPDGESRLPGTLTLFTDGPQWKVCLSDRAQGLVAFVSGESPADALGAADRGLRGGTLDWRATKGTSSKRR